MQELGKDLVSLLKLLEDLLGDIRVFIRMIFQSELQQQVEKQESLNQDTKANPSIGLFNFILSSIPTNILQPQYLIIIDVLFVKPMVMTVVVSLLFEVFSLLIVLRFFFSSSINIFFFFFRSWFKKLLL
jgi:hypothetical protein